MLVTPLENEYNNQKGLFQEFKGGSISGNLSITVYLHIKKLTDKKYMMSHMLKGHLIKQKQILKTLSNSGIERHNKDHKSRILS